MKKLLFIIFVILFVRVSNAAPIDVQQAQEVGVTFLVRVKSMPMERQTVTRVYPQDARTTQAPYYIFNVGKGFVIVAGDDAVQPILAYSTENSFSVTAMPAQIQDYLSGYAEQVQLVRTQRIRANEQIERQWTALSSRSGDIGIFERGTRGIAPLLTTTWDQNLYYNSLCFPIEAGPGGHAYAGCVACAMSQIIHYWGAPSVGKGTHQYTHNSQDLIADYAHTTYNHALMPNQLTASSSAAEVNAVATLMYHCGIGVNMNYGSNASGAHDIAARVAFINHFGYNRDIQLIEKSQFTDAEWISLLKEDIDRGCPIYYSGSGSAGGHAFVCDGYDNADFFHFNWGWSGSNNGYFAIGSLAPGNYNFSSSNAAIIHLMPADEESYTRPAAPTHFSITPADNQQLSATLTFTVPTVAQNGSTLTSLNSIVIKRNQAVVHTIANPIPGNTITWTDANIPYSGNYQYEIYAVRSGVNGVATSGSVEVGTFCAIGVKMIDSFGDGWNGSVIEFVANGQTQQTITLNSGSTDSLSVNLPAATISCRWVSNNSYDYESSFLLYNSDNQLLYSSNGTPVAGEFYNFEQNCSRANATNAVIMSELPEQIVPSRNTERSSAPDALYLSNTNGITTEIVSQPTYITHPNGYNDLGCVSWDNTTANQLVLTPSDPNAVLSIEALEHESQNVSVYDGVGTEGTLLFTLDGSTVGQTFLSTSHAITIAYSGNFHCIGYKLLVSEVSCLPFVNQFTCTNRDIATADLSWNIFNRAAWENTDLHFRVEYDYSGFEPGSGQNVVAATDTFITLSNLHPDSDYEAYLWYQCSNGDSVMLGPCAFQTLPLSECMAVIGEENTTSYRYPYNPSYYTASYTQQIYTVEELEAAGHGSGDVINHISLQYRNQSSQSSHQFVKIYMGNTQQTSFASVADSIPLADLELVYAGNIDYAPSQDNAWTDIYLTNYFSYWGNSIVVVTEKAEGTWEDYGAYNFFVHATQNSQSLYVDNESSGVESVSSNIRFCRQVDCMTPQDLSYEIIDNETIALSWNSIYGERSWNVEFGPSGFEHGSGERQNTPTTSIELSELEKGYYDFHVNANCGEVFSDYAVLRHIPIGLNCVTIGDGNEMTPRLPLGNDPSLPNTYSQQLFLANEMQTMGMNGEQMIYGLSFQYAGRTQVKDTVKVSLANTTFSTLESSWIPVETFTQVYEGSVTLKDGMVTIAFQEPFLWDGTSHIAVAMLSNGNSENGSSQYYVSGKDYTSARETSSSNLIDLTALANGNSMRYGNNMQFCFALPNCLRPTNFAISNTQSNNVILSWSNPAGASQWEIEYGPIGFARGNGTTIYATDTFALLNISSGSYDFYVCSLCGEESTSGWSSLQNIVIGMNCGFTLGTNNRTINSIPVCITTNSYSQQIITADELRNSDIAADNLIRSIAVMYGGTAKTLADVTIYLGHRAPTDAANLTDAFFPFERLEEVFSDSVVLDPNIDNGWIHFDFTSSFGWDGQSDVIVAFVNNSFSTTNTGNFKRDGTSVQGIARVYSSNTAVDPSTLALTSGDGINYKNYMQLCISEATCINPKNLSLNGLTSHSVDLQWDSQPDAPLYEIICSDTVIRHPEDITSHIVTSDTAYTLSNLQDNTTYYVYIRTNCGHGSYSIWSRTTFTTFCNPIVIDEANPYMENFEDSYPLTCWQYVYANANNVGIGHDSEGYERTNALVFENTDWNNRAPYDQYAVCHYFESEELLKVSFKLRADSYKYFQVGYSMQGNDVLGDDFIWFDTAQSALDDYAWDDYEHIIPRGAHFVAIHYISYYTTYDQYIHIDNFKIETVPCRCNAPQNIALQNLTPTSATYNWNASVCGESDFQYLFSTAPIDTNNAGTLLNTSDLSLTFNNLTPQTTYYLALRSVCGENEYSSWEVDSFTTFCTPITITEAHPYTEDFESYTASTYTDAAHGDQPDCWAIYLNATGEYARVNYPPHVTTDNASHGKALGMLAGTDWYGTSSYALLPRFTNQLTTLQITFTTETPNPSYNKLYLGYVSNAIDMSTFTKLEEIPLSTDIDTVTYTLDAYTFPADALLGFAYENDFGNEAMVAIDDIDLRLMPICEIPSGLTATPEENTINLTWNPSVGATSYNIFRDGTRIADNITDNHYADNGLTVGTYCYTITNSCPYGESAPSESACAAVCPTVYHEFTAEACEQYAWNDEVYTQSGTYQQNFETTQGCDSIVTLHLTIHQPVANEFTATACDEYVWNNSTYTESGTYQQHFTTAHQCDSTVTLHLTIYPSATNEFSATACDEYVWNEVVYTQSGDYEQRFVTTSPTHCDSIVTLHLTIHPSQATEFTAEACEQYTWNY